MLLSQTINRKLWRLKIRNLYNLVIDYWETIERLLERYRDPIERILRDYRQTNNFEEKYISLSLKMEILQLLLRNTLMLKLDSIQVFLILQKYTLYWRWYRRIVEWWWTRSEKMKHTRKLYECFYRATFQAWNYFCEWMMYFSSYLW